MKDLCNLVGNRMHIALDGKEIDMSQNVKPTLEHMLGITSIGEIHDPKDEEGTLLDPTIEFWEQYNKNKNEQSRVETRREVREKVETAVRLLQEDDLVNMRVPYGENSDLVYVSVDDEMRNTGGVRRSTECIECGARAQFSKDVERVGDSGYREVMIVVCNNCGFEQVYESRLSKC